MKLEIVGQTLYQYFSENRFFKVLLPLDLVFLLGAAFLNVFSFFIDMGGFVHQILIFGFILGVLLTFSKSNYLMLTAGFSLWALKYLLFIFYILLCYRSFPWNEMLPFVIYGALAFQSYKKSIKINLG